MQIRRIILEGTWLENWRQIKENVRQSGRSLLSFLLKRWWISRLVQWQGNEEKVCLSSVSKVYWKINWTRGLLLLLVDGASLVAQQVKHLPAMQEPPCDPWFGQIPGGGHGKPLQHSCLENPHGQRCLVGYSPWGCKESGMTDSSACVNEKFKKCNAFLDYITNYVTRYQVENTKWEKS